MQFYLFQYVTNIWYQHFKEFCEQFTIWKQTHTKPFGYGNIQFRCDSILEAEL